MPPAQNELHIGIRALAITIAIQVFTTLASRAPSVLAAEIAPSAGLSPNWIGVYAGLLSLGAMLGSLLSGEFVKSFGPIRVSQISMLTCVLGAALTCGPLWMLALAPVVMGLGAGAVTPASSHLLARTTGPEAMATVFSLKQTAAPIGIAIAGAILPALSILFGWPASLGLVAVTGVVLAILAQPSRSYLDTDHSPSRNIQLTNGLSGLAIIRYDPTLREFALVGLFFTATQTCVTSFLVVHLIHSLDQSLVSAGLAFSLMGVAGIIGRIGLGRIADKSIQPKLLLGILGLVAGLCSIATASFTDAWPSSIRLVVIALFGVAGIGWVGIQLALVARYSPRGQVATVTGGTECVAFAGAALGPALFSATVAVFGDYRFGFGLFGCINLLCASWLLTRSR